LERHDRVGCAADEVDALRFLILTVAGWPERHREQQIAYLLAENAVYKEHFAKRGLRLTDVQRRRLAVKGKAIGRKTLDGIATIATPDTTRAAWC
jgi:putative transposase